MPVPKFKIQPVPKNVSRNIKAENKQFERSLKRICVDLMALLGTDQKFLDVGYLTLDATTETLIVHEFGFSITFHCEI